MSPFHPPWRSFPALFVSETITKGSSCTGEHQAATAQPVLYCCSLNSSGFSDESPPTHEAPAVPSAGLDAELYYVRNNVVNHHALSCPLPVPSETNSLHFTWHSKTKVGLSLTHTHTHTTTHARQSPCCLCIWPAYPSLWSLFPGGLPAGLPHRECGGHEPTSEQHLGSGGAAPGSFWFVRHSSSVVALCFSWTKTVNVNAALKVLL